MMQMQATWEVEKLTRASVTVTVFQLDGALYPDKLCEEVEDSKMEHLITGRS